MTLPMQGPSAQPISPQVPSVPALFTRLHPQLVTDCPSLPVDARAGFTKAVGRRHWLRCTGGPTRSCFISLHFPTLTFAAPVLPGCHSGSQGHCRAVCGDSAGPQLCQSTGLWSIPSLWLLLWTCFCFFCFFPSCLMVWKTRFMRWRLSPREPCRVLSHHQVPVASWDRECHCLHSYQFTQDPRGVTFSPMGKSRPREGKRLAQVHSWKTAGPTEPSCVQRPVLCSC